jgi:hypothetical protein
MSDNPVPETPRESKHSGKLIPIVTANCAPLRFISRGLADSWSPTTEQINKRTYDHIKLHRLSTYLDIGIGPFSLGVCFDGTLILPATKEFLNTDFALKTFNTALSQMLLGGIYSEAVSPDDIGFGAMTLTGYSRSDGGGDGPAALLQRAARNKHIGTLEVIWLLNPEIIQTGDIESALATGRKLLSALGDIPSEQILYGITFFAKRQWAEALIHLWTTTERVIEIAWRNHVISDRLAPSKRRRQFLDDHRTWTASAKLEVLFQKGLLPREVYERLDHARKARNEFAHRAIVPSQDDSSIALQALFELASLCVSEFDSTDQFAQVITLAKTRCHRESFPKADRNQIHGVTHWLTLPLLPGDKNWKDEDHELIPELRLQPLRSDD